MLGSRIALAASLATVAWTHAGYPLAAAAAARLRRYEPARDDTFAPPVALVIAAHDEEAVIAARLENALALDYPELEIVVASDGSTDRTNAIVRSFGDRGVRLLELERSGKVPAQNAAVRATTAPILAFSDANALWQPDALRRLVAILADPEVGYVCGRLDLIDPDSGENREGLYWRYELWQRLQESRLGAITAGNGAIYAVRREAYVELDGSGSHDIGLPHRLRRAGYRSLYAPDALASERAAASTGAEWGRKVRMLARAWNDVVRGGMLDPRGQRPAYYAMLISHRLMRYTSGLAHLIAAIASVALLPSAVAALLVAGQVAFLALAAIGRSAPGRVPLAGVAWYYLVVTAATLAGLVRFLRHGAPATWRAAEGTR